MNKKRSRKIILILFLLTTICPLSTANAAIPHLINYQGRLTDSSGVLLIGSYQLTFRIYDAETAGNLLWQETHTGVISKGIFSLLFGSVTNLNLPFDRQYYSSSGGHAHTLSGSSDNAGSGMKVVAVYYALCFIMKL